MQAVKFKDSTVRAGRWTALSAFGRLILQLAQTMILARLLGPHEFGTMAVISGFISIVIVLADLGFSRSLIHFQDIPSDTLSSLYCLNLLVACILAALTVIAAPLLGRLYDNTVMPTAIALSSLVFPFTAFGQQLRVLAEKRLDFKLVARVELASSITGVVIAIFSALVGMGVYALVLGMLATALMNSAMSWILLANDWRPRFRLDARGLSRYITYGLHLAGENFANMARMQLDVLVAGSIASPATVGFYSVSKDLSLRLANSFVNPIITKLGLPIMAEAQHDRARLKTLYMATIRMVSAINFLLYAILGLFAEDIILVLYGNQWQGAVYFLQGFAAWSLIRSTGNPVGTLLYAAGETRRALYWNIALLAIVGPMIWLNGIFGNMPSLMWTLVLTQGATYIFAWRYLIYPLCGASFKEYIAQSLPALIASLISCITAVAATSMMDAGLMRLAIGCGLSSILYGLLSWVINRGWVRAMLQILTFPR